MLQEPTFASHIICHSIRPDASLKNLFPMASKEHFITYQPIINEPVQKRSGRCTELHSLEAKTMYYGKQTSNV